MRNKTEDETDEELKRIVVNTRLTDAMKKFSRGAKGKEGFNKLFNKFMQDYFESDFIFLIGVDYFNFIF